jgi:hypothetical protein
MASVDNPPSLLIVLYVFPSLLLLWCFPYRVLRAVVTGEELRDGGKTAEIAPSTYQEYKFRVQAGDNEKRARVINATSMVETLRSLNLFQK